jgi:hypothetical protein
MKRLAFTTLLLLTLTFSTGAGPGFQTIAFDEVMNVNPLGDADMTVAFTLTASQFASWNQKYGQNKSLLKRDMEKIFSQYDTYDWDINIKEMERQVTVGLKAHGLVQYKKNGRYEFPVPKSWKGGQIVGHSIDYNFVEPLGAGALAQFNAKVNLPESASAIHSDTGESGEKIIRYDVPVGSINWLKWSVMGMGGMILLLGTLVAGVGLILSAPKKTA